MSNAIREHRKISDCSGGEQTFFVLMHVRESNTQINGNWGCAIVLSAIYDADREALHHSLQRKNYLKYGFIRSTLSKRESASLWPVSCHSNSSVSFLQCPRVEGTGS